MKKAIPFVDEVRVLVKGGSGGAGAVSFRRQRSVPYGGPDGGDGGDGGSVYLVADRKRNSLSLFRHRSLFSAPAGRAGGGSCLSGKSGASLDIPVPVGTFVRDADTGELIGEVNNQNTRLLVAKGGSRGFGNVHFKSSTDRASKRSTKGTDGDNRALFLELELLADVALAGLPNAGKSSLLAAISNARPRVSDYQFTTLFPGRGVVCMDGWKTFVVADLPGIISGASQGRGLGAQLLKHTKRSRLLLHLCDVGSAGFQKALEDARTFMSELNRFSPDVFKKERWLVLTKCDLLDRKSLDRKVTELLDRLQWQGKHFCISIHDAESLEALKRAMLVFVESAVHGTSRE